MHELTQQEKQKLYEDGFIVLRGVVPRDLTFEARRTINMFAGRNGIRRHYHDISTSSALPDLINKSDLGPIMRNTMGPFDPPQRGFAAILYPQEKQDSPNYGWHPHLDGLWASRLPKTVDEVDDFRAPRTDHFGSGDATSIGANMTPFFQDPECTLSLGSFTAFVGVGLNDQTEFGRGNLCLLKAAHELVEAQFRKQNASGGVVGPEGADWPRLHRVGENNVSMTPMPIPVRDRFLSTAEEYNGIQYLKPSPILLDEGDAVIALHACPHGGTRNESADPRMNVYFRLRHHREGGAVVMGDSDHPDRGWHGEFLDYAEGYNPWEIAISKLCDHWSEWDGMRETVRKNRAQSSASTAKLA